VGKALVKYERHLRQSGYRPRSLDTVLMRLGIWLDSNDSLTDTTQRRLQDRYDKRCEQVAAATHHGELAEVKTFFRWCRESGLVRKSPAESIKPKGKKKRGKVQLHRGEARAFFIVAAKKAKAGDVGAMCALAVLLMGLRSGEIRKRRVRDVDADAGKVYLWISEGKTDAATRCMEVPLPLAGFLANHAKGRKADEWLFPSPVNPALPMVRTWLIKVVNRICKEANVTRVCPHGLRGTWATITTQAGVAGHVVSRELGHTSEEMTTRHYTKPGALDEARTRQMLKVIQGGIGEETKSNVTNQEKPNENKDDRG
jgi:integrase